MDSQATAANSNRLLSPAEAANFLGLSRATVYRLMSENQISYSQVCGRRRFRQRDLDDFVEQRLVAAR